MRGVVTLADRPEPLRVEVDARDRLAFERIGRKQTGLPTSGPLQDAVATSPETYTVWLCWHAARRIHGEESSFDGFAERVTGVELEVTAAEARAAGLGDPTRPAP